MCNKQLYFSLYEGLVSFHTVEYRLEAGRYSYSDLRKRAFAQKAATGAITYTEDHSLYVRLRQGVVLKICDYDTPLLFIKINPRILVEEDHSYLGIFHATAENIEKIYSKASAIVQEYVPGYSLEDASLCRVDLCLNITCNQPDALIQLIACLKRCDWRSQYQTTEFSTHTRNAEEKNKHSFRILSKHFSLTVYDKLFERTQRSSLEPEHPDGLLRVEFGLQDEMAIGYYLHDAAMTDREKLLFLAEKQWEHSFPASARSVWKRCSSPAGNSTYAGRQTTPFKIKNQAQNESACRKPFLLQKRRPSKKDVFSGTSPKRWIKVAVIPKS